MLAKVEIWAPCFWASSPPFSLPIYKCFCFLVQHEQSNSMLMQSHRVCCSMVFTDRLQNEPLHYCKETHPNVGKKHPPDKFIDSFITFCSFTTQDIFEFVFNVSKWQKMLPFCQLIFVLMHKEEAKFMAEAPLPSYDLSRPYRVSMCGRQLSLKLVTVQPPKCLPNGQFICLRAMHYGRE